MNVYYQSFDTPAGRITAVCDDLSLWMLTWNSEPHQNHRVSRRLGLDKAVWKAQSHSVLNVTEQQLNEYFQGKRRHFELPIRWRGSDFQKNVWGALQDIPYGHTISYAELAAAIGNPSAVRAVANANGANALPIIIPCHRVIGSDGKLAGYTGGVDIKEALLEVEGIYLPR
jgi:methylated-DNA-[protein]-cysteine S-methyltransferase